MYALKGTKDCPQQDPDVSWWLRCPVLHTPNLDDILNKYGGDLGPYPLDNSAITQAELAELEQLSADGPKPLPPDYLSIFFNQEKYYSPPPYGAVLPMKMAQINGQNVTLNRPISTGVELASLFESETPGLWHRHVLNVLMAPGVQRGFCQLLTPPRQALIWATLDLAILTALSAAWQVKWLSQDHTRYRSRPWELAQGKLRVLFDYKVEWNGSGTIVRTTPKDIHNPVELPPDGPGTPRHPSFVSGHSVYSSAASWILSYLVPRAPDGTDLRAEYIKMADNIGEARMWGGVHWRSDHERGLVLGKAVADVIIEQLNRSGIIRFPEHVIEVPAFEKLEQQASVYEGHCGKGIEDYTQGMVPPDSAAPGHSAFQALFPPSFQPPWD